MKRRIPYFETNGIITREDPGGDVWRVDPAERGKIILMDVELWEAICHKVPKTIQRLIGAYYRKHFKEVTE